MYRFFIIFCLGIALYADAEYFLRDVNHAELKQCAAWFEEKPDQKIIHLHNGKSLTLNDEYAQQNLDIKSVLYTLKGCFFDENYLIFSQFVADDELYYLLNITDGTLKPIEGMAYLSPKHATIAVISDIPSIAFYALNDKGVKQISQFFLHSDCTLEKPRWQDEKTFFANLTCNDATLNQNLKVVQSDGEWKIVQIP